MMRLGTFFFFCYNATEAVGVHYVDSHTYVSMYVTVGVMLCCCYKTTVTYLTARILRSFEPNL